MDTTTDHFTPLALRVRGKYVQETGRAGRDGEDAHAILYEGKSGWQASQDMKSYMLNKTDCRRKLLFGVFLNYSEIDIDLNVVIFVPMIVYM